MPTTTFSNAFLGGSQTAVHNFETHVFKVALMASGFTFDRDAHDNWADVSASEIAAGNGYTAGGATIDNGTVTVDDGADDSTAAFDDEVFTASGGDFPAAAGVMFYNDTPTSPADPLICYVAFDADETLTDGNTMTLGSLDFIASQAP